MNTPRKIDDKILTLRIDYALFPGGMLALPVPSRAKREASGDAAIWKNFMDTEGEAQQILVVAKNPRSRNGIYDVGTLAQAFINPVEEPGEQAYLLLSGTTRIKISGDLEKKNGLHYAKLGALKNPGSPQTDQTIRLLNILTNRIEDYVSRLPVRKNKVEALRETFMNFAETLDAPDMPEVTVGKCATYLGGNKYLSTPELQRLLEVNDTARQIDLFSQLMDKKSRQITPVAQELAPLYTDIYEINEREAAQEAKKHQAYQAAITHHHEQQVLQQQGGGETSEEMEELAARIKKTPLSPEAVTKIEKGMKRLQKSPENSSEAGVQLHWIETVLDLPWGKKDVVNTDIKHAAAILDRDHYGLTKVKQKVSEYLAVQKRQSSASKAKILLLVGPPGVGKTSIAASIAEATGQKYTRMALGSVRDEAEMRGHRRTYIGAEPGQIIKKIISAGTNNPVFVLDEIDKLSSDHRGNPADALLEVLDPAQNNSFQDHFIDINYDLSGVTFIATANEANRIPHALYDRMEVIEISGYTAEEKLEIAQRHLVAKAMTEAGLTAAEFSITPPALEELINNHTQEAGVRDLFRQLGNLCSKTVQKIEFGEITSAHITPDNLEEFAGKSKIIHPKIADKPQIGYANGLAVTSTGGVLLPIEAVVEKFPAKDFSLVATGLLRESMKESVPVAVQVILANPQDFHLTEEKTKRKLHIHAPTAVPKDGPSAGVLIATVALSALGGFPVRNDVAMTGEISLKGKVMPVGGIPQKLTGAFNAGVKTVLIPAQNYQQDLDDVPKAVRDGLKIIPVSNIREAFHHAFTEGKTLFPLGNNDNKKTSTRRRRRVVNINKPAQEQVQVAPKKPQTSQP